MFTQAIGDATSGFEGDWRFLADFQGVTLRQPTANLRPVFNATYRELRELVSSLGYTQFLTRGTTTALPTTPFETGETYATITLGTTGTPGTPFAASQVKMIDVRGSAGQRWRTLPECTLLQLRDHAQTNRGDPRAWCLLNVGSVSGANYTAGAIAITPTPQGGHYVLWTLPEWVEISSATDVFLYHTEAWRRWHMFRAMAVVCGARDKDSARKLEFIMSQLDPDVDGSPAALIHSHAPTAAGPKTWTRDSSYRGSGPWR